MRSSLNALSSSSVVNSSVVNGRSCAERQHTWINSTAPLPSSVGPPQSVRGPPQSARGPPQSARGPPQSAGETPSAALHRAAVEGASTRTPHIYRTPHPVQPPTRRVKPVNMGAMLAKASPPRPTCDTRKWPDALRNAYFDDGRLIEIVVASGNAAARNDAAGNDAAGIAPDATGRSGERRLPQGLQQFSDRLCELGLRVSCSTRY